MCIYILVLVGLFSLRGRVDLKGLACSPTGSGSQDTMLVVAGFDVAPALAEHLVSRYKLDYPHVFIQKRGGGTSAALEDLVNSRAGAVFMSRPPTADEQGIFDTATGDTVLWYPVALGAIQVIQAPGPIDSSVTLDGLRALASGKAFLGVQRLYAPDPNSGLWDAFRAKLELPFRDEPASATVVFLKDDSTVVEAVLNDDRSIGLVSSFVLSSDLSPLGVRVLGLQATPDAGAVHPDIEATSEGDYPLWCYLYLGCLPHRSVQATMFVTFVTSPRGQRLIEQTDFLPAQLVPREVIIKLSAASSGDSRAI
jgi:ABC-type phosphate transport system substrate-binding protein